jgi:hypothetical protein
VVTGAVALIGAAVVAGTATEVAGGVDEGAAMRGTLVVAAVGGAEEATSDVDSALAANGCGGGPPRLPVELHPVHSRPSRAIPVAACARRPPRLDTAGTIHRNDQHV